MAVSYAVAHNGGLDITACARAGRVIPTSDLTRHRVSPPSRATTRWHGLRGSISARNSTIRDAASCQHLEMPPQIAWLLLEGLLPLFGAGAIYLVWGVCTYAAATAGSEFNYRWKEAADPLGWLYGSIIIDEISLVPPNGELNGERRHCRR